MEHILFRQFPQLQDDDEVILASGDAEGTQFRILLKTRTDQERTLAFACPNGFGQNGSYPLLELPAHQLERQADQGSPSVNFAQIREQTPLEAVAWCTIAPPDRFRSYYFERGFYYSMHYAAIETLILNGYNRIHIGSLSLSEYAPDEVIRGIEAFVHLARKSDREKLDFVIGGACYFSYHFCSYAYLDHIEQFVDEALLADFDPVKTILDKNNPLFSDEEVKRFNIQRRFINPPERPIEKEPYIEFYIREKCGVDERDRY
jgi:hypothetical protein